MQIKTTLRFHLTPVRMAKIKNSGDSRDTDSPRFSFVAENSFKARHSEANRKETGEDP